MDVKLNRGILNVAIDAALNSDHSKRMGAVIFKGKRIYSSGWNSIRYTRRIKDKYKKFPCSLHAEQSAILNATRDISGCSILVVRLGSDGKTLLMARPCEICMSFIVYKRIKNIFYSNQYGNIVRERLREIVEVSS